MKVRITDLLDIYYDDSVKLSPPEEIFEKKAGKEEVKGKTGEKPAPRGRGYKILLVAASLLLVITGAFTLMVSFQPKGGKSLGEGAPLPSTFGTDAPDQPKMAPSVGEDDSENLAPQAGIIGSEIYASEVHLLSYTQRGETVSFDISVENMGDFSQEEGWTVTAVNGVTAEDVRQISAGEAAWILGNVQVEAYLDEGSGTLYAYGDADMTGQDAVPEISLLICDGDGQVQAITRSVTVPYNAGTAFAIGSDDHHIFDFEDAEFSAGITKFAILREKQIYITLDYPTDSHDMVYWAELLMEKLGSTSPRTIAIYTEETDGTWTALDIDFSQVAYTLDFPQSDDVVIEIDCSDYDFDPEQVVNIEFHSPSASLTEENEVMYSVAEDTDGDGYLTADLDLTLRWNDEPGALTRLTIDQTTGEYTWYRSTPALTKQLYEISPAGDYSTALEDKDFQTAQTEWANICLGAFQREAHLVFTDGSSRALGSGSTAGFDGIWFWDAHNLKWLGEDDGGIDYSQKTISYLEINGVRYDFY